MAIVYNTGLVRNGLVVLADPCSAKVYPGSGTSWYEPVNNMTGSLNGISIGTYTPSAGGTPATAFLMTPGGTVYPTLPDSAVYDFRSEISWDCVACKTNDAGRQSIWAQINTGSPWDGMGLVNYSTDSNGQLGWWAGNYGTSGPGWWNTGLVPATNKWVYAAGTWSGTTLKAYLWNHGGSSFSTATTTSYGSFNGNTAANTFRIGDNGTDAANATHIIDGAVALVRIWNRKLSDSEVTANFESIRGRYGL